MPDDQDLPKLEALTHRLSECPGEFLLEPVQGKRGAVHVDAVVSDLLLDLGGKALDDQTARRFTPSAEESRNALRLTLVGCWLGSDPWFLEAGIYAVGMLRWLTEDLPGRAAVVDAERFVTDPERREELARSLLATLGLTPLGESREQAADRLTALDSVERARVIRETRAAEEKARKLREAMAAKRAREAAAKAMRE